MGVENGHRRIYLANERGTQKERERIEKSLLLTDFRQDQSSKHSCLHFGMLLLRGSSIFPNDTTLLERPTPKIIKRYGEEKRPQM